MQKKVSKYATVAYTLPIGIVTNKLEAPVKDINAVTEIKPPLHFICTRATIEFYGDTSAQPGSLLVSDHLPGYCGDGIVLYNKQTFEVTTGYPQNEPAKLIIENFGEEKFDQSIFLTGGDPYGIGFPVVYVTILFEGFQYV